MSILIVSIDSVILKQEAQFVVQVASETQTHKTASTQKTVSPIFNRNTFDFDTRT